MASWANRGSYFVSVALILSLVGGVRGERRVLGTVPVEIGHSVGLSASDIPVQSLREDDYCILELIQDDPLYSMVGSLSPSVS